jgi:hypothetical protein
MKKIINNTWMAFVAVLALALSSCAKSDNSEAVQPPVVGQWESTDEEGWLYYEDGETVEIHYIHKDNWLYIWFYDEDGSLIDSEVEEEIYEPGLLNIWSNGMLSLSNSEGEMMCNYVVKGHQILLPEWGDDLKWNFSIEEPKMVIEEQSYYEGVLDSRIIIHYQRK